MTIQQPVLISLTEAERAVEFGSADAVVCLGIGAGELVMLALQRGKRVLAWDRDPAWIREFLSTHDVATELASGTLHLLMGTDILLLPRDIPRFVHPRMGHFYQAEVMLDRDAAQQRVALAMGALFVADAADALHEQGFGVFTIDFERLPIEEVIRELNVLRPAFVLSINIITGLAEFLEGAGFSYVAWEIDPATSRLPELHRPCPRSSVFTYRRANEEPCRAAGFAHVEYLPLAANTDRRIPTPIEGNDVEKYGSLLSFVGSSMWPQATEYFEKLVSQYEKFRPGKREEGDALLTRILAAQAKDYSRWDIPQLLSTEAPEFSRYLEGALEGEDPVILLSEIAASQKRLSYVGTMGLLNIKVWGDDGWKALEPAGVKWMGLAGHYAEINKIYSATEINIDVGRLYQSDIVTMRVFDVLSCGGFLLAEHSDALAQLFSIGEELDSYSTLEELSQKIAHYTAHPEERARIASAGCKRVLLDHTISARMAHIVKHYAGAPSPE